MVRRLLLLAALGGCADAAETGACALGDHPEVLIVRRLSIAVADDQGVSAGFDQDGEATVDGGGGGCGIGDYVSPEGVPGIDNAFSRIVPTLNATEARLSTIEGLVQASINSGELLVSLELGGVDSWADDACVALELGRADGVPMLGTDGYLLDGQTFDRKEGAPTARLHDGAITDGELTAAGLSIDLPVNILDVSLALPIREGQLALAPTGEDTYEGLLAGAVSADFILEVANGDGIDDRVGELLGTVLSANADLPDEHGTACNAMSMTLRFEAVGAYYFEE